jgi:hypothetical protein
MATVRRVGRAEVPGGPEMTRGSGPRASGDGAGGRDAWAIDGFAPLPGDVVFLPDAMSGNESARTRATVETVYLCSESNGVELIRWSWIVLADGRLLEIAPRGCTLYDLPTLVKHGSGAFLELAAQDGALVRFEERVRAGVWQARPVRLALGGRRWKLTSTGTVTAQRLGPAPASGWGRLRVGGTAPMVRHLEMESGEQDVYFTFAERTGEQAAGGLESGSLGLGVWMNDIYYAFGRRLGSIPTEAGLQIFDDAEMSR